jgi:hypothetical protein
MRVFNRKKHHVQTSRAEALEYTPVKNIQVTESRLESGEILLFYPVAIRPWIAALVRRFGGPSDKIETKKIELDVLGAAVWDMIDGNRSVRQIIREFAEQHQLHPREAEVSVTQFLRSLGKRGLIGLQ